MTFLVNEALLGNLTPVASAVAMTTVNRNGKKVNIARRCNVTGSMSVFLVFLFLLVFVSAQEAQTPQVVYVPVSATPSPQPQFVTVPQYSGNTLIGYYYIPADALTTAPPSAPPSSRPVASSLPVSPQEGSTVPRPTTTLVPNVAMTTPKALKNLNLFAKNYKPGFVFATGKAPPGSSPRPPLAPPVVQKGPPLDTITSPAPGRKLKATAPRKKGAKTSQRCSTGKPKTGNPKTGKPKTGNPKGTSKNQNGLDDFFLDDGEFTTASVYTTSEAAGSKELFVAMFRFDERTELARVKSLVTGSLTPMFNELCRNGLAKLVVYRGGEKCTKE